MWQIFTFCLHALVNYLNVVFGSERLYFIDSEIIPLFYLPMIFHSHDNNVVTRILICIRSYIRRPLVMVLDLLILLFGDMNNNVLWPL